MSVGGAADAAALTRVYQQTVDEVARLIHKTINPNFESLGNDYWTPKIVWTTWYQAETGSIPVSSGAGYLPPRRVG